MSEKVLVAKLRSKIFSQVKGNLYCVNMYADFKIAIHSSLSKQFLNVKITYTLPSKANFYHNSGVKFFSGLFEFILQIKSLIKFHGHNLWGALKFERGTIIEGKSLIFILQRIYVQISHTIFKRKCLHLFFKANLHQTLKRCWDSRGTIFEGNFVVTISLNLIRCFLKMRYQG